MSKLTGHDPTAPDVAGARKRHPDWSIGRERQTWTAVHREGLGKRLTARSLESLEGKITRAGQAGKTAAVSGAHSGGLVQAGDQRTGGR